MDFEASFEAKLQEHLNAVDSAAASAKARVAQGIAGLRPAAAPAVADPVPEARNVAPEGDSAPRIGRPAVSFDEPEGGQFDDEGIPVWEDPP